MDLLKSFELMDKSRSIRRYSRDFVFRQESVLEHTGWVALWSYLLAKNLEREVGRDCVDYGKLLSRAVVHDIDEVVTGDVPRTTKYSGPRVYNAMKELAERAVTDVAIEQKIDTLSETWMGSKDHDTLEGLIVSIADSAAVIYMCWVEIELLGNKSFQRVAKEAEQSIKELCNACSSCEQEEDVRRYLESVLSQMFRRADIQTGKWLRYANE